MRHGKNRSDTQAINAPLRAGNRQAREMRGWGPFTGGQLTVIIVAVVVMVGLPVIASAAIPNGNTYNACALKTTGALRVIDTSKHQKCNAATEIPLSWSKTGAKGAQGAPGADGTNGVVGLVSLSSSIPLSTAPECCTERLIGATPTVTVATGQMLVASITVDLGSHTVASIDLNFCALVGGVTTALDLSHLVAMTTQAVPYSFSVAVVSPPLGTYEVGFCADHAGTGSTTLDITGNETGSVIVVN